MGLEVKALEIRRDTAWVLVQIDSVYTPELDNFIESGTSIPLTLQTHFMEDGKLKYKNELTHTLTYNLTKDEYSVSKNSRIVVYKDKNLAKSEFPIFRSPLIPMREIKGNSHYKISITCTLGKIKLDVLDKQEFDLMSLWNFERPSLETAQFTKSDLMGKGSK